MPGSFMSLCVSVSADPGIGRRIRRAEDGSPATEGPRCTGALGCLILVVTLPLASILRRLPGRFFLAAAIAVIGVVLLAGNGAFRAPTLGDLLILVAAIVRAVHVTSMHKLTSGKPMDALHLTTVQLATCAALFSATSLFYGDSIPRHLPQLDPDGRCSSFISFSPEPRGAAPSNNATASAITRPTAHN